MINNVKLKNFKCYQELDFDFSNITIFCGSNSSGKSTVIQSILLFVQNQQNGNLKNGLLEFMGEYYSFGALEDIQCHTPIDKYIEVVINELSVLIDEEKNSHSSYLAKMERNLDIDFSLLGNDFIYLSADRYGPKNSSDIKLSAKEFDVGIYGEYAFSEYDRLKLSNVSNILLAQAITDLKDDDIKLNVIVKDAMNAICPGFSINTSNIKGIDKVTTNFSSISGKNIRPTNVGFGFSCIFPIVLAAICMKPGGILVIENPEVHLHPKAQSKLAQFLSLVAEHDIQVIIETHSDHMVNGLRVYAKNHPDFKGKSIINSISNVDEQAQPKKMEISLDENGRFNQIEEGFFDQIQKDLMELF